MLVSARADSSLVTTNLWIPADTGYFFRYYKVRDTVPVAIANNALPLYWDDASDFDAEAAFATAAALRCTPEAADPAAFSPRAEAAGRATASGMNRWCVRPPGG